MKLVDFKCPNCGSGIKADTDSRTATCEYCGSTFAIDDESLTVNVNLSVRCALIESYGHKKTEIMPRQHRSEANVVG